MKCVRCGSLINWDEIVDALPYIYFLPLVGGNVEIVLVAADNRLIQPAAQVINPRMLIPLIPNGFQHLPPPR